MRPLESAFVWLLGVGGIAACRDDLLLYRDLQAPDGGGAVAQDSDASSQGQGSSDGSEDTGLAVSVGEESACALLSGGTVECWGYNGAPSTALKPVEVSGLSGATAISVGQRSACALLSGGTVECWGNNAYGELGNGTTTNSSTPVAVSGLTGATAISVGGLSACALLSGGTVECWGYNQYGELGDGTTTGPATCSGSACSVTPVAVSGLTGVTAASVGVLSACALLPGGTVECWGYNASGELGN